MGDRFFVEHPIVGDSACLTGQEAEHLKRVLRAKVGDRAVLFDGSGTEFPARITRIDKHSVECAIVESQRCDRELPRRVELAVALPKGDRQRFLVEKLVELGVASLTPLVTRYSVVQPDPNVSARLQRFVIEASKQCGRNRLMAIASPRPLADFLASLGPPALRFIAHPQTAQGGPPGTGRQPADGQSLSNLLDQGRPHIALAVGPEGGFTVEEIELAVQSGWQTIDLGPRWLRIETAAIALAAIAGLSGVPRTPASGGLHS